MTVTAEFLTALPKCEVHLHIEGTLEPELRFQLAARNGIQLEYSSTEEVRASYQFDDLSSFLASYYAGMEVLRTEPDFFDLARTYFERVAAQNLTYVELFFDPQAHTARGVPLDVVIRALRRAQQDAQNRLGIRSALIMCFPPDVPAEAVVATLLSALPY